MYSTIIMIIITNNCFTSLSPNAEPCALYCRVGNVVYSKGTVKDGTRVTKKGPDVCIQGNPEVIVHSNIIIIKNHHP